MDKDAEARAISRAYDWVSHFRTGGAPDYRASPLLHDIHLLSSAVVQLYEENNAFKQGLRPHEALDLWADEFKAQREQGEETLWTSMKKFWKGLTRS